MIPAAHCQAMLSTLYGAYHAKSVTTILNVLLHLDTGENDYYIEAPVDGDQHAVVVAVTMAAIHGFVPMDELEASSVYNEENDRLRIYLVPSDVMPALKVAM